MPPKSPFFAPATPRKLVAVQTPGGTSRQKIKKDPSVKEKSTTIAGATSNLVNAVIGAGIVGMPYAIRETGLVAGAFLIVLCAMMTEKSLRILIGTAKHVGVSTYERLFESTYGLLGFYFVSINMVIMAYGGCLTYLMIIKDTLPVLLGVSPGDVGMERAVLTISTMAIILPISMQRVSDFVINNSTHISSLVPQHLPIKTGHGGLGENVEARRPITMLHGTNRRRLQSLEILH